MSDTIITSLKNPLVKHIRNLSEKTSARKAAGQFVVEGVRECSLLRQRGFKVESWILCDDIYRIDEHYPIYMNEPVVRVSKEVYESIAYRGKAEGVIAIALPGNTTVEAIGVVENRNPLYIALCGVEKPGNIGAIFRTCDAVGVDGVFICDPKADIFNPNCIRASLGTVFTVPFAVCGWNEAREFFVQNKVRLNAAKLGADKTLFEADFRQPTAIVLGTEADGLSEGILSDCHQHLIIPMNGKIDSLNVSVSSAVFLYEAVRQRH